MSAVLDVPAVKTRRPRRGWQRALNLQGLAFLVVLGVIWEILARTVLAQFDNLPSASETLTSLGVLLSNGQLLPQIGHTLQVTFIGWVMAVLIGTALGLWLGLSRTTWRYSMATVEVLRSIPSISFVPVAILIFGFSRTMELVIVVYVCIWPVLIATIGGVRGVHPGLLDTARTLTLGRRRTTTHIVVPAAVPRILVGLRLALALAIALAVIAEMLGNPEGLGFGIVFVQRAFQPGQTFAYLLAIGVIGWLLNWLFTALIRRFAPRFAGSL